MKGRELQNRLRAGARGAGGAGLTYLFREQEAAGKAVAVWKTLPAFLEVEGPSTNRQSVALQTPVSDC